MKLLSIYMSQSINITLDMDVKSIHVILIELIMKIPKLKV